MILFFIAVYLFIYIIRVTAIVEKSLLEIGVKYRPLSFFPYRSLLFSFFLSFFLSFFFFLWAKNNRTNSWFPCELWCERRLRPRLGIQTTVQRYPELSTEGLFTHTYIYLSSYLSLWIFPGFCVLHSLASIHSVSLSLSRVHELSISLFLFRSFGSSCSDHLCFSNLYNIYIYIYMYMYRVCHDRFVID